MQPRNISALILAGGQGSRLRSVIGENQKVFTRINGRPFISYLFKQVADAGISDAILCLGYKSENAENEIKNFSSGLNIRFSRENSPAGTGGAIALAISQIQAEYIMIMNGDSYLDFSLASFIGWGMKNNVPALMATALVPDVSRFGQIVMEKNKRIISFREKNTDTGKGFINAGVYFLKKDIIEKIFPDRKNFSIEKDIFPLMVEKELLYAFPSEGRFIDIGTPESYKAASDFFQQQE